MPQPCFFQALTLNTTLGNKDGGCKIEKVLPEFLISPFIYDSLQ
jgi:hypothetical protein